MTAMTSRSLLLRRVVILLPLGVLLLIPIRVASADPPTSSTPSSSALTTQTTQGIVTTTRYVTTTTKSSVPVTSVPRATTTLPRSTTVPRLTSTLPPTTPAPTTLPPTTTTEAPTTTTTAPTTTTSAPVKQAEAASSSTGRLPLVVGGLVGVGTAIAALTFLFWRHTRPEYDDYYPYDDEIEEAASSDDALAVSAATEAGVSSSKPALVSSSVGQEAAVVGAAGASALSRSAYPPDDQASVVVKPLSVLKDSEKGSSPPDPLSPGGGSQGDDEEAAAAGDGQANGSSNGHPGGSESSGKGDPTSGGPEAASTAVLAETSRFVKGSEGQGALPEVGSDLFEDSTEPSDRPRSAGPRSASTYLAADDHRPAPEDPEAVQARHGEGVVAGSESLPVTRDAGLDDRHDGLDGSPHVQGDDHTDDEILPGGEVHLLFTDEVAVHGDQDDADYLNDDVLRADDGLDWDDELGEMSDEELAEPDSGESEIADPRSAVVDPVGGGLSAVTILGPMRPGTRIDDAGHQSPVLEPDLEIVTLEDIEQARAGSRSGRDDG